MVMLGVSVEIWLNGFGSSVNFFAAFVGIAVDALRFDTFAVAGDVITTLTVDLVLGRHRGGDNFDGSIFLDAGDDDADELCGAVDAWQEGENFGIAGIAQSLVDALVFSVFAIADGVVFTDVFDGGVNFFGSVVLTAGIAPDFADFIVGGGGEITIGGEAEHLDLLGLFTFAVGNERSGMFFVLGIIVGAMNEETVDVAIENRRRGDNLLLLIGFMKGMGASLVGAAATVQILRGGEDLDDLLLTILLLLRPICVSFTQISASIGTDSADFRILILIGFTVVSSAFVSLFVAFFTNFDRRFAFVKHDRRFCFFFFFSCFGFLRAMAAATAAAHFARLLGNNGW